VFLVRVLADGEEGPQHGPRPTRMNTTVSTQSLLNGLSIACRFETIRGHD